MKWSAVPLRLLLAAGRILEDAGEARADRLTGSGGWAATGRTATHSRAEWAPVMTPHGLPVGLHGHGGLPGGASGSAIHWARRAPARGFRLNPRSGMDCAL